jgi:Uma2 family endonuclease
VEASVSLLEHTSPNQLIELARELDGRAIPGLRMSEREFDRWVDEEVRAEWVDGEVVITAPVSGEHSDLNVWLLRLVSHFVEARGTGIVRGPEFRSRLASQKRRRCPDVMFVSKSRARLLRPMYFDGAPDLIIEIVSPDSESRDWREKFLEYESAGVREYWIADPQSQRVKAYTLGRDKSFRRLDEVKGRIDSKVLRGLFIKPEWLWRSPLPKMSEIAKALRLRR